MLANSAKFEDRELEFVKKLQKLGHEVFQTAGVDDPIRKNETMQEYRRRMHKKSIMRIRDEVDAILAINLPQNGQDGFIGAGVFSEIVYAFVFNKKIFILYDLLPRELLSSEQNLIRDEIEMSNPIILNGDLSKIS